MEKKKLQEIIIDARKRWGFSEEDYMLLLCGLTSEVGEVATAVRGKYIYNKPQPDDNDKSSLKHEMADVLIFLAALADKCGIDLEEAVLSKIKLNDERFSR